MSSAEATRRLGLALPVQIGEEAATRIRRQLHRQMFKRGVLVLSSERIDECMETYNEVVASSMHNGARVRRISAMTQARSRLPASSVSPAREIACYGMLLDWVATDGDPLPSLVVLECQSESAAWKIDVVVAPPTIMTLRGKWPDECTGWNTEFLHLKWSIYE